MNSELFDFVDNVRRTTSSRAAANALVSLAQSYGASVVNTFFGTERHQQFVSTFPDWYHDIQYGDGSFWQCYTVDAVRSGIPSVYWGIEISKHNPRMNAIAWKHFSDRYDLLRQRSSISMSMPSPSGNFDGAGIGIGFDEPGERFMMRMQESGGALATAAFAAFSRIQFLQAKSTAPSRLSKRQAEILQHLAAGRKLGEIADRLGISDSAVNLYLYNLRIKLGVKTKEQVLAQSLINGWTSI